MAKKKKAFRKTYKKWLERDQARIAAGFDRVMLHDFYTLEEYRQFAARSLRAEQQSLERRVERDLKGVAEEHRDHYHDSMYDEYVTTDQLLPQLQWYAHFMIVYATFEYMLNHLCKIVQNRSSLGIGVKDLRDEGIATARNYLVKVARVESPFQAAAWHRAMFLREVRNAIAHRNGEVNRERHKPLFERLEKEKHVKLKRHLPDDEDAHIIIDGEFVKDAIIQLQAVLASIANYPLYARKKAPT